MPGIQVKSNEMIGFSKAFWASETGATSIEYGVIAAVISIAIVAALQQMGPSLAELLSSTSANLGD